MTVSYTASVATCKHFGCFWKLLFRWKASIYKLIWPNMLLFLLCYTVLSLTYRFALNSAQRQVFEDLSVFCDIYRDMIPVSFVLGFYVSIVVKRWWDQYQSIPWPDPLAVLVSVHLTGSDTKSRLMRRTVMRYVNVCLVMTFRLICPTIKRRFPTMKHLVDTGYLLNNELEVLIKLESKTMHPKYWVPIVWAAGILARAKREKLIKDDMGYKSLIDELNRFRQGCLNLFSYDWISIPLVYTQVVTLAVYSYFLATLMATQYLDPSKKYPHSVIDLYVPYFAILQFFFFMGWLLVAESLVNPFGENDDDIEVGWLVDRNLQVSYLIVDEVHQEHPKLLKDPYWDDVFPQEPPATRHRQNEPYLGSTWEMQVSKTEQLNKSLSRNFQSQTNRFQQRSSKTAQQTESNFRREAGGGFFQSVRSVCLHAKHSALGIVGRPGSGGGTTEVPLPQIYSRSYPNYSVRDEPNVSGAVQERGEGHAQVSPPHSWHGFTSAQPRSDSLKLGKMLENYNAVSRSLQQPGGLVWTATDPHKDMTRSEEMFENFLEGRGRRDATDRPPLGSGRCHYMTPGETPAPSTTLYTINEERDVPVTNQSDTG